VLAYLQLGQLCSEEVSDLGHRAIKQAAHGASIHQHVNLILVLSAQCVPVLSRHERQQAFRDKHPVQCMHRWHGSNTAAAAGCISQAAWPRSRMLLLLLILKPDLSHNPAAGTADRQAG
jgi:hypothetical protein